MIPAPIVYGLLAVFALHFVCAFLLRIVPMCWKIGWHADLVLINLVGSLALALLNLGSFVFTAIIFLWVVGKTTP